MVFAKFTQNFQQGQSTEINPTGKKVTGKEKNKYKFGTNYILNYLGGGQRSKRRYLDSRSFCSSCRYDIKPTHTPLTCTNRKSFHNEAAIINNQIKGVSTNCHFITAADEWWCGKVNSNKISQNKINKTDLNNYTTFSRNSKHISYVAAVTNMYSGIMTRLSTLTSKSKEILNNKNIPQGHPDSAATSMFFANRHKYLGKEQHHEEVRVGVANTNTIDSVTTQQLQLTPELPMEAQKGHGFNEIDRLLISVPVLCDVNCTVV